MVAPRVAARHVAMAMLTVMVLIFVGSLARTLYIDAVNPRPDWVSEVHLNPLALALGVGIATAAVEGLSHFTGLRRRQCLEIAGGAGESPARG